MSAVSSYVVRWDRPSDDGAVFAPGSLLGPEAIVGSPVSLNLNYHHPVGTVLEAVNDGVGCLVSVQLDFGREGPRTEEITLNPVYRVTQSSAIGPYQTRICKAFLLQVSLMTH